MTLATATLGDATRDAFGEALRELGETRPDIVVLDADLAKSTKTAKFGERFPERFRNVGIQEANMVGIAGGLARSGKSPFIGSFACFLLCKGFDQIRMSVAYPELNVKLVGSHGGIVTGPDGASQQSVEDLGLAMLLPGLTVVVPSDAAACKEAVKQLADLDGPAYIRTCRPKAPVIYGDECPEFELGKAIQLRDGGDLTFAVCGMLVHEALDAAGRLADEGIEARVLDVHTLRPMDEEAVQKAAAETGAVVTAEEHLVWGGLGAEVSRAIGAGTPVPIEHVGLTGYAESGESAELLEKYGLTAPYLVEAAKRVLARK